jgi:hypothetical protein
MKFIRLPALVLGIGILVLGLSGCATTQSDEAAQVEPSYPVKSIAEAKFSFDNFDKKRAIKAYNKFRANLLFELVIDREGNVVMIRTIRSRLDDYFTFGFKGHVQGMKFTPASSDDPHPYRTLFYPVATRTELEIR